MFFMVTLPLFFMVITGFALYSEGTGRDSWEFATLRLGLFDLPEQPDVTRRCIISACG